MQELQQPIQEQQEAHAQQQAWDWSSQRLTCEALSIFEDWTQQSNKQHAAAYTSSSRDVDNNIVKAVAFSPDGTCVLSASEDCLLRVFEVGTFQCAMVLKG